MLSLHPSTRLPVASVLTHAWLIGTEKAASLAERHPQAATQEQLQQAFTRGVYADGPQYRGSRQMPLDFLLAPEEGTLPTYRGMPNMSAEVLLHQSKAGLQPPCLERQHAFRGILSQQ